MKVGLNVNLKVSTPPRPSIKARDPQSGLGTLNEGQRPSIRARNPQPGNLFPSGSPWKNICVLEVKSCKSVRWLVVPIAPQKVFGSLWWWEGKQPPMFLITNVWPWIRVSRPSEGVYCLDPRGSICPIERVPDPDWRSLAHVKVPGPDWGSLPLIDGCCPLLKVAANWGSLPLI